MTPYSNTLMTPVVRRTQARYVGTGASRAPVQILRDADGSTRYMLEREFDRACDLFVSHVRTMQYTNQVLTPEEHHKLVATLATLLELHDVLRAEKE